MLGWGRVGGRRMMIKKKMEGSCEAEACVKPTASVTLAKSLNRTLVFSSALTPALPSGERMENEPFRLWSWCVFNFWLGF